MDELRHTEAQVHSGEATEKGGLLNKAKRSVAVALCLLLAVAVAVMAVAVLLQALAVLIVAALAAQRGIAVLVIHRLLLYHERSRRFERQAHIHILTVGDTALNAAGVIRAGTHAVTLHVESIIMLAAAELRSGKTAAYLKALAGRNTEHGMPQRSLQLIKHRVTQAHRAIAHGAGHHSAQGVPCTAGRVNGIGHLLRHGGICRAHHI
jgi:hypothetical protein